jgi:hypothetical protein
MKKRHNSAFLNYTSKRNRDVRRLKEDGKKNYLENETGQKAYSLM